VAKAEWPEIDLDSRVWTIPATKMKMRRDHQVPLSQQAQDVSAAVKAVNGNRHYVFATYEDKPLSGNTFNTALRIMGYDTQKEHCAHGFRTTTSTLPNEQRGADGKPVWRPDIIELQQGNNRRIVAQLTGLQAALPIDFDDGNLILKLLM
jgi:integrase